MEENKKVITTDTIVNTLKQSVENKLTVPPSWWIDAAQKLNVLLGDEHDKLFNLEYRVANMKVAILEEDEKRNVSAADVKVKASEEYKELRKQKAKVDRIEEFIRIAKIQARLKDNELNSY